jgi:hypothetical protein
MQKILALMVLSLGLILSGPVWAQPGDGQGTGGPGMGRGMGPGGGKGPMMYNPQTVTTITGTMEDLGPKMGRMQHVSWIIKTAKGSITVHLGPAQFINQYQISLKPGDPVEATGSQMEMGGAPMLVAKEVKVGGKTYQLRDDQGVPLWRGQGQAPPK